MHPRQRVYVPLFHSQIPPEHSLLHLQDSLPYLTRRWTSPSKTKKKKIFHLQDALPYLTRRLTSPSHMKIASTVRESAGRLEASPIMRSVIMATCPRQSVVPLPYSLSPSRVRWNGSTCVAPRHTSVIALVDRTLTAGYFVCLPNTKAVSVQVPVFRRVQGIS